MSYPITKFLVHPFSERIAVFQYVGVLPNWGMVFWLDFILFFLSFLTSREMEGWQGASYKPFLFKIMFWPISETEEIIIAGFVCGLNYATGYGSLSDHTTPDNCAFLTLFSYYSDNPIFSNIPRRKMIAWRAEKAGDKIRILGFDFIGIIRFCVSPSPVNKVTDISKQFLAYPHQDVSLFFFPSPFTGYFSSTAGRTCQGRFLLPYSWHKLLWHRIALYSSSQAGMP